jgi:hypothetical protein
MTSRRNSLGAYCTQWAEVPDYDSDLYEEYISHLVNCAYHAALEDEFATEFEQQGAHPSCFPLPAWTRSLGLTGSLNSSIKSLSKLRKHMLKAYEFNQSGREISALEFRASGKRLARISLSKWRLRRQPSPFVVSNATRSVEIWDPRAKVFLGLKILGLKANQFEVLKFNQKRVKIKESLDNGKLLLTITCEPVTSTIWEQMAKWAKRVLVPALVIYGLREMWQKSAYLPAFQVAHTFNAALAALLVFFVVHPNVPDKTSTNVGSGEFEQRTISHPPASNYPIPSTHPPAKPRLNRVVARQATINVAREVEQAAEQIGAAPNPATEDNRLPTPPSTASAVTEASKSEPIFFSIRERGADTVQYEGVVEMYELNSMLKATLDRNQPVISDSQQEKGLVDPIVCAKSPDDSSSTLFARVSTIATDGKEEPLTKPITRQIPSCNLTQDELRMVLGEVINKLKEFKNEVVAHRSNSDAFSVQPGRKSQATIPDCEESLEY